MLRLDVLKKLILLISMEVQDVKVFKQAEKLGFLDIFFKITALSVMYLENISKYTDVAAKLDEVWENKIVTVEFIEKKYIMNSVQGDILPWKYVILTSYNSFFKPVHNAMTKIILISAGVFILALIMVLAISKVMYNPIRRLWNTLGSSSSSKDIELMGGYTIEPDYSSFNTKITHSKSLDEIRNIYFNLFETEALSVEKCRGGKSLEIVSFVKKIIEEDYANTNISLNSISDRLKMSTVYLGSLFKSFEEISVSDYIQKVRVENSSNLLTETNRSISEILEAVGWENKKYFNTIFKKYYSVTPSEYRIRKTVKN